MGGYTRTSIITSFDWTTKTATVHNATLTGTHFFCACTLMKDSIGSLHVSKLDTNENFFLFATICFYLIFSITYSTVCIIASVVP